VLAPSLVAADVVLQPLGKLLASGDQQALLQVSIGGVVAIKGRLGFRADAQPVIPGLFVKVIAVEQMKVRPVALCFDGDGAIDQPVQ